MNQKIGNGRRSEMLRSGFQKAMNKRILQQLIWEVCKWSSHRHLPFRADAFFSLLRANISLATCLFRLLPPFRPALSKLPVSPPSTSGAESPRHNRHRSVCSHWRPSQEMTRNPSRELPPFHTGRRFRRAGKSLPSPPCRSRGCRRIR